MVISRIAINTYKWETALQVGSNWWPADPDDMQHNNSYYMQRCGGMMYSGNITRLTLTNRTGCSGMSANPA